MLAQTNQRIDGKRLWDSLMSMAEIGATAKGGVRRLTLTEVDQRGPRPVPRGMRGGRADGPRGRDRQYVRTAPWP